MGNTDLDVDAQKDLTYRMSSGRVFEIQQELVDLSQHIWTKCTDETPIRLQRSINEIAPSSL